MNDGKKCMIAGCQNIAVARDLCDKHRKRVERHGDPLATRAADWGARERHPLYRCWNAIMRYRRADTVERWHDLWKFVEDLGDSRPSAKHLLKRRDDAVPLGPDNFYWQEPRASESTAAFKERRAEYMRAWTSLNARKLFEREIKKRYGITADDYERMLKDQDGVCAICGQEEKRIDHRTKKVSRLAVDHCHKSGNVRALLCHHCNNALGCFDDDFELMVKAICYVATHAGDAPKLIGLAISRLEAARAATGTTLNHLGARCASSGGA